MLFLLKGYNEILFTLCFSFLLFSWFWINKTSIKSFSIHSEVSISNKNALGVIFKFNGYNIFLKDKNLNIYDKIFISGTVTKITNKSTNFNIEHYLKSFHTFFEIKTLNSFKIITRDEGWRNNIFKFLSSGNFNYSKIFPVALLGENFILDNDFISNLKQLNIYHIFVISGFHLGFLRLFIFKILKFLKINNLFSNIIFVILLSLINYILNFPISFLRATLFFVLSLVNKVFLKNKFKNFEILSFVGIIFILWNPLVIYSFSYIFTFLITLVLLYCLYLKIENKLIKNFISTVIVHIFASILLLFFNEKYNIFSYLNSLIFLPFAIFIYVIGWLFIWEKNLLDFIAQHLLWIIEKIANFQIYIQLIKLNFTTIFICYIIFSICFLSMELIHISRRKKLNKFLLNS
ncbi:MAG0480 family ComEC-like protein [Mesomycoplasma hyorhinis]|uniref:MAG0480 family ComEC-like protein n=1 Tax=Mesomycoplasma hyorhinis TaxID=2100 RepID=UPI00280A4E34|nr:ComEC/Rec2 family competence protein [Mesomycoplasma hyorhinis]